MASLPILSGRDVVKAFAKAGHMATLSVPDHQEVARGTLRSLIRSSGLTVEQFAVLAGK